MNDPTETQMLEALRRDRETLAPEDAQARVASRLGILGPFPGPAPREGFASPASTGGVHTHAALVIAFLGGAAVGVLLHAGFATLPAPRVVYVDRPTGSIPSAAPLAVPPTSPEPSAVHLAVVAPVSATVARPSPHPTLTQLDAERALLDAAHVAIVAGDSNTALGALDRHARTYRRPLLGEERDALWIQALVRAGRYDEARARADGFRRTAPQSLFLPAVDAAMASIP